MFQKLLTGKKGPFVVVETPEQSTSAKEESGTESEHTDTSATPPVAKPAGKGKAVTESKPAKLPATQPQAKNTDIFPPAA
ncbi:hypothetical protein GGI16_003803 [Coemansia sp. S142-1]|nr:hypothetical protein GGI16_003803 [Coemansia sp. S142-1]